MSANANLVELVSKLDLEELQAAKNLLNHYKNEGARQYYKELFSTFRKECLNAFIDIEYYIEVCQKTENFPHDCFIKLKFLAEIYENDEEILAKLSDLETLCTGYNVKEMRPNHFNGLMSRLIAPNKNSVKILDEVHTILHAFQAYKRHVLEKIKRVEGVEACDVRAILLNDDNSSLSEADQNGAKEANIPLFIKRPSGWRVYGNLKGEWRERGLENLSEKENKALNNLFNLQEDATGKVNKTKFPMELKPRLRELHTFSNPMRRHELETFMERLLNNLLIQNEHDELELMNSSITTHLSTLIDNFEKVVANDDLSFVDKLRLIYQLYRDCQQTLQPIIKTFLYPNNGPSIEKLRFDIEGELQKTLGAYIRGKIAPEDIAHFTNEFIQTRLIASYFKMCMFYINTQMEKSLRELFPQGQGELADERVELLRFAFLQASETSNPIEEKEFFKVVKLHSDKLEMAAQIKTELKQEFPLLVRDVSELLSFLKKTHPKIYSKVGKMKETGIKDLEQKITRLQKAMNKHSAEFLPLFQQTKKIETRWAKIKMLSQAQEALQELECYVNPKSLEENPPLKVSRKKGAFGFFSHPKEDNTQNHSHSVPLHSEPVSVSPKKAISLPTSTAVSTPQPGSTASPSIMSPSKPGLRIKAPSNAQPMRMIGKNPTTSQGSSNVRSTLVGADLAFEPVEETTAMPTGAHFHPPGLNAPATFFGPSLLAPLAPPADDLNRGANMNATLVDMDAETISEYIEELEADVDVIPENLDIDAEAIPEYVEKVEAGVDVIPRNLDSDSDTISESLSNIGMRLR